MTISRQVFTHNDGAATAYSVARGRDDIPGIFYLAGHRNPLETPNSARVAEAAASCQLTLTQFAYWGWDGSTHPDIPEAGERYAAHWLTQAVELFDAVTQGPQILVGYSMGGMLMLGLALARPARVRAMIGLAAGFGDEFANALPARYGTLAISTLDKTVNILLRHSASKTYDLAAPLPLTMPMCFYNDTGDAWVSPDTAKNIMQAVPAAPSQQEFKSSGTHRFDQPEDAMWLARKLKTLAL